MSVVRLSPPHAEALYALRQRALREEPLVFGSAPDDDRLSVDFARAILAERDVHAVFAEVDAGALVGMVGVLRSTRVKTGHRADIYGMYVAPEARRRGVARALLDAAVDQCRAWGLRQVHLSVSTAAPPAQALYASAGFERWGTEPAALMWAGAFYDEHHLVLMLTGGAPAA